MEVQEEDSYFIVKSPKKKILSPIRDKLKKQRIRDSARKVLLRSMEPNTVSFFLNKQAAFMGRIHFVTDPEQEDYLGPITVTIEAEEEQLKKIIDWLTMVDFQTN